MTEPQELRSIDDLFRDTFHNLPDTPASTGWDTPSERVWKHVQEHIQAPKSGWSLQSMLIMAGFAVTLAVGLYFAFSTPAKVDVKPIAPLVSQTAAPVEKISAAMAENVVVASPNVVQKKAPALRATKSSPKAVKREKVNTPKQEAANSKGAIPHVGGAAPLPGTHSGPIPNTREQLKAEHHRQMEIHWKTPLHLLPIPHPTKKNK